MTIVVELAAGTTNLQLLRIRHDKTGLGDIAFADNALSSVDQLHDKAQSREHSLMRMFRSFRTAFTIAQAKFRYIHCGI